jgi:hypothetical protein
MERQLKLEYKLNYDPKKVDIRVQYFTVEQIVEMIEEGRLEIVEENDLQRLPDLWDEERKSLLIESILINLPLPMYYFDGSVKPWQVIDGLQRLTTLFQFVSPKAGKSFRLKGLQYLNKDYSGFDFEDLPLYMKDRILQTEVISYVINPGTPSDVKYSIFDRLNSKGLKLNGQELRNAAYKGWPTKFIRNLLSHPEFAKATNNKVPVKRMADRELVNRFIAFYLFSDSYKSGMDEFLRLTLQYLETAPVEKTDEVELAFLNAMDRSLELLGPNAFVRAKAGGKTGRGPNKALFDTISWNMARMPEDVFLKLQKNKNRFQKEFKQLQIENLDFEKSINDTTSSKKAVINRLTILDKFIKDFYDSIS